MTDSATPTRRRRLQTPTVAGASTSGCPRCGGLGLLLEVAFRLIVIGKFSVDTANGVNSVITVVVIGVLVMATVVTARRVSTQAVSADRSRTT